MKWALRLLPPLITVMVVLTLPPRINKGNLRDMTAPKAITAIHIAETQYYSQYGRYAPSLVQLGHAELIDRDLANGQRGGFKIIVQPTSTGYAVAAAPLQFGTTGTHTYFSDESMAIHSHTGREPATLADPRLGETVQVR